MLRSFIVASLWLIVSSDVCFVAKDDLYGKFTTPLRGSVIALKLVSVLGYVISLSGNLPYGLKSPGMPNRIKIGLFFYQTQEMNKYFFPRYEQRKDYILSGYHITNLSELVFNILSAIQVATWEE